MTEQVIEQEQKPEKVLLANWLDTVYMVPKMTILFIFRGDGQDWELIEERKPPLKKEQVADWEDGFYKIEVRNPTSNRFIYPNVLYVEVANGEIIRKSVGKPFRIYDEPETPTPATVENPTPQFTGMEVIAKVLEQQTQILNTLMAMLMQKPEDKKGSGFDDVIELYRLKMLKKLEKEILEEENDGVLQMTPEEQQLVDSIMAHLSAGQFGTALMFWKQLQEKNEALAQTVLANVMDLVAQGKITFPGMEGGNGKNETV